MVNDSLATWRPNWAIPPGELLAEALEERGMSQAELARRMNRPLKTVNEIVKAKTAVTPETAVQLEMVLGIAASFWIRAEANYREQLAREQLSQQLESDADWVHKFPVQDLVRRNRLRRGASAGDQLAELLRFFGVSSRAAWGRHWNTAAASFRRSAAFTASPEPVAAWLRIGEIEAEKMDCEPFDAQKLERMLPAIRRLTLKKPLGFRSELVDMLKSCGVALVLTPELRGTHMSGATRWLSSEKVLVQLSLRHRTNDQFWFALLHELGHVLGGGKRQAYLDLLDQDPSVDEEEMEAVAFARSQLVPEDDYARLVEGSSLTAESITQFAEEIGVSPGIVVGRLQRDGRLPFSAMNYLKEQFRWLDDPRR